MSDYRDYENHTKLIACLKRLGVDSRVLVYREEGGIMTRTESYFALDSGVIEEVRKTVPTAEKRQNFWAKWDKNTYDIWVFSPEPK